MRPLLSVLLALVLALALDAASADLPETYQVIAQRNLFSPSRVGTPPPAPTVAAAPPAPTETVTLIGVAVLEGEATALFAGSTPILSGARHPGDRLDQARISAVSTVGVSVDTGSPEGPLRLAVGQSLQRFQGQPWQRSAEAVSAAASPAAAPAALQSPTPSGDAGDILKRLLERRQKEMKP